MTLKLSTTDDGELMASHEAGPSARIICDSVSPDGVRLTTMQVKMHRFVLAEMNTHRAFSRNSASSRAIPSTVQISRIQEDLAYPVFWGSNQSGMQAGEELEKTRMMLAIDAWKFASLDSIDWAKSMHSLNLHKQIVNRILEPYMWHTAVITATEWDNFFHQRCSPMAQPEMKAVADCMQYAYYSHEPQLIEYGGWHLPYLRKEDMSDFRAFASEESLAVEKYGTVAVIQGVAKRVSVARCARVSYLTQKGQRDFREDLNLFERLETQGHWSPFEHIATPMDAKPLAIYTGNNWSGNFRGWKQIRKEYSNENITAFAPNLPELIGEQNADTETT